MYLGAPLTYFFSEAAINIHQGPISINLLDYFPLLKQGYSYYGTATRMLYLYIIVNGLVDDQDMIMPDDLFIRSFDDKISAEFYIIDESEKISMTDAINTGLIARPMNTLQVVKYINDDNIPTIDYNIEDIVKCNSYIIRNTPKLLPYLHNDNLMNHMRREYNISDIQQIAKVIYNNLDLTKDLNLKILLQFFNSENQDIFDILLNDDRIKLLCAIIIQDIELIEDFLFEVDARNNDNYAYYLAIEEGNAEITEMIRKSIMERNWYDDQVLHHGFESVIGIHNPAHDIRNYMKKEF